MADPATLLTIATVGLQIFSTVFKARSQTAQGESANKTAQQQAALQEEQGQIAQQEALLSAERAAEDRRIFLKRQRLAFVKSGVSLEGSPLLILEQTRSRSQEEVDAIVRRGIAQKDLAVRQADITRRQGRAALTGGIAGATSTVISGAAGVAGTIAGSRIFETRTRDEDIEA